MEWIMEENLDYQFILNNKIHPNRESLVENYGENEQYRFMKY